MVASPVPVRRVGDRVDRLHARERVLEERPGGTRALREQHRAHELAAQAGQHRHGVRRIVREILRRGLKVEWWGNIRFEKRLNMPAKRGDRALQDGPRASFD